MSAEETTKIDRPMMSAPVVGTPQPTQAAGWNPPWWAPLVVVAVGGGLSAALPFVSGPALTVITVALGVLGSLAGALGIRSAGTAPRQGGQ